LSLIQIKKSRGRRSHVGSPLESRIIGSPEHHQRRRRQQQQHLMMTNRAFAAHQPATMLVFTAKDAEVVKTTMFGSKSEVRLGLAMSGLAQKADVRVAHRHVCFGPLTDITRRDLPALVRRFGTEHVVR
jgi:hypothetical protein